MDVGALIVEVRFNRGRAHSLQQQFVARIRRAPRRERGRLVDLLIRRISDECVTLKARP